MLFTCYNYHSNNVTNTIIFIKNNNIINVYSNNNYDDYDNYETNLLFVITEEDIIKYPILYRIYIISTLLTENPAKLNNDEYGYSISKKTIWKNLYITRYYDCEDTFMTNYPEMSYILSTNEDIYRNLHIIYCVNMIDTELLFGLIYDEVNNIEKELLVCEDYTKNLLMYSLYIKKIIPDNIPDDMINIILSNI
jgi:hypothetical protein